MINYASHTSGSEELNSLIEAYSSGNLSTGKYVTKFENEFRGSIGSKYACAVSSGTSALHLCAEAIKKKYPRDGKVITTSLTFVATAAALHQAGYTNIAFADIDPKSFNIDLNEVESLLKESKAGEYIGLVIVHFAGNPVEMQGVNYLAKKYGLWVIEDVAHALGSSYIKKSTDENISCGSCEFSDCSAFSFHPAKNITTGEGGMITSNDREIDTFVRLARSHFMDRTTAKYDWEYDIPHFGYNYRMTDLQASMGRVQLKRLNEFVSKRRLVAEKYEEKFSGLHGIKLQEVSSSAFHSRNLFVISIKKRDKLYESLKKIGFRSQVIYKPLHRMKVFENFKTKLTMVESYSKSSLALPIYPDLNNVDQDKIVECVVHHVDNFCKE